MGPGRAAMLRAQMYGCGAGLPRESARNPPQSLRSPIVYLLSRIASTGEHMPDKRGRPLKGEEGYENSSRAKNNAKSNAKNNAKGLRKGDLGYENSSRAKSNAKSSAKNSAKNNAKRLRKGDLGYENSSRAKSSAKSNAKNNAKNNAERAVQAAARSEAARQARGGEVISTLTLVDACEQDAARCFQQVLLPALQAGHGLDIMCMAQHRLRPHRSSDAAADGASYDEPVVLKGLPYGGRTNDEANALGVPRLLARDHEWLHDGAAPTRGVQPPLRGAPGALPFLPRVHPPL